MRRRLIRNSIRKMFNIKEHETINDFFNKYKVKMTKIFYNETYSKKDLKRIFGEIGLENGMQVMVHASWREFYNFSGSPEDVIEVLESIIGKDGTLLMPSYGNSKYYFNVQETPSSAGVLSEVFRKKNNVLRSKSTHFSIAARGKKAEILTDSHINSQYGFDEYSPYYSFAKTPKSKILLLGLNKTPAKISLFHCATYLLRGTISNLKKYYTKGYESKLIVNKKVYRKKMIGRNPNYKNNDRSFKKLYKHLNLRRHKKISNLDIVIIDANEGLEKAFKFVEDGNHLYKKNVISKIT